MDDNTIEKKQKLVRQIRSQYNRNQYDLSNREQILYGRTSLKTSMNHEKTYRSERAEPEDDANHIGAKESLKFRSIMAVMLLVFAIIFDLIGVTPGGIEMQQIFQLIASDYQENL